MHTLVDILLIFAAVLGLSLLCALPCLAVVFYQLWRDGQRYNREHDLP